LDLLRKLTPEERLQKAISLTSEVVRLSKAAIRRRFPEIDEDEVKLKFIALHYGKELADEVREWCRKRKDVNE